MALGKRGGVRGKSGIVVSEKEALDRSGEGGSTRIRGCLEGVEVCGRVREGDMGSKVG